ncbi:hypothetical protein [Clostridium massiliamazoniense]|uniref:hypothetical protein n=1 Tax=Clostridium massiliamazoniense TaxID=1347366 RepID=UPI0006D784B1|nr:hypothetical protein [Clostridium massiliamazoniense]
MREKVFLKYKIESMKLPLVAYFFIILGLIVFRQISISMVGKEYFQIDGIESTTIVFLFSYGAITFIESFKLSQGFNLSRKKYLTANMQFNIIIAVIGAFINLILYGLVNLFSYSPSLLDTLVYWGEPIRVNIVINFLWFLLISFLSITLGIFFVALYYRSNNLGRILTTALIVVSFIGLNLVVILFPTEVKRIVSYSPRVIGIIFTMFNFKIIKKIKVEG